MNAKWISLCILTLGAVLLSSCNSGPAPVLLTPVPTLTPLPTLPSAGLAKPLAPGEPISYSDLQVTMTQAETSGTYETEYGPTRIPPQGVTFVWIHVSFKNTSAQSELTLPAAENFSILYGSSEFKPTYGHRKDYTDFTSLKPAIYQGQQVEAWLRFDVPAEATLADLTFAYIVGGFQVSLNGRDKPTYLWACVP